MRIDRIRPRRIGSFLAMVLLVLNSASSFAHPMGNFSINHYSKITLHGNSLRILYLIDMAEIPTYQEIRRYSLTSKSDDPTAARYLNQQENTLKAGVSIAVDGRPLSLQIVSHRITFTEGAGGLPTMKLELAFHASTTESAGEHNLAYFDHNFAERAGWREIVVSADAVEILRSSAPATDRSLELTNYSSDALNSPPQQRSALIDYRILGIPASASIAESQSATSPSARIPHSPARAKKIVSDFKTQKQLPAAVPLPKKSDPLQLPHAPSLAVPSISSAPARNTPRNRFTSLISTQNKLSFWFLLSAALIAASLGALHALEPGHGKTIVAAYLAGSRGTAKHAVLLGIIVTASHTAGVFLLGAITLYASRYIVPEQLYPWLGAISGLSVAGLGVFIFLRHLTGESAEHSHAPGAQHSHWFLSIFKRPSGTRSDQPLPATGRGLSIRELCILGITGGIVPCPAALVVLLSAFSLHRIGFGLFLISAFSLGLATVLVIVGLVMVYTKQVMSARIQENRAIFRYLPLVSSVFMSIVGIGITVSAIGSVGFAKGLISSDKLVPFVTVILLGLFLGMRHSTDPDHVVAVSTIVSRQGSIRGSAAIGLLWGLGHTLTIFLVGSAIIVFGVVIPPRVGLSMEFCVALMLILLGLLNLTGVMGWVASRLASFKSSLPAPPAGTNTPDFPVEPTVDRAPALRTRIQTVTKATIGKLGLYQTLRPLAVGLVHGLAGSAAVALLVLSTIKSPLWSTAYLLVFGIGTMAGMMLMTVAISLPLVYTRKTFFSMSRHLTVVSGLASMAFGMFLVYQIGFVDGLFTSHVHWTPQ
jgi:high-affinity nickel-transport protein